jgi:16S rRNA C967 or C1407 C5-methylase (RsmB/RsmF family)/NOL1/NOP2/fmu family ribosome biogenesis protein
MHPKLPEAFKSRVTKDEFLGKALVTELETDPTVSIRYNPQKTRASLPVLSEVKWCKNAFYLKERPVFTLDPLFHAGSYYPQEAGSMLLDHVLRSLELPQDPMVLDLCAAPGGKSTLIASYLNGKGVLVSNELIPQRAAILRENIVKWGSPNTIVTNNKPSDFNRLPHFFDVIVVDAPCSGEGMFRKDKNARSEWSESNVFLCADRQKTILTEVWDALRPGGHLIYSTCTFNRLENEDNVKWIMEELGAELIRLDIPNTVLPDREDWGAYCLPGTTKTEGFYLAVVKKPVDRVRQTNLQSKLNPYKDKNLVSAWFCQENYTFYERNEWIYALPITHEKEMLHVQQTLRLLKLGVCIGSVARKGIIPSEELALFNCPHSEKIPKIELDRDYAIRYLKGETFSVQGTDGWNLIIYEEATLGWIKKIGSRFNNHYPKDWRIRMRIE